MASDTERVLGLEWGGGAEIGLVAGGSDEVGEGGERVEKPH
jgi:hypothetical protein